MSELELGTTLRRGSEGKDVKRVQEWLSLHGFSVQMDGQFGPATDAAVRGFQRAHELTADGVVTEALFGTLVAPMQAAVALIAPARGEDLGALTVRYARQHLMQHPREVGGDNRGPWVRLYMKGRDGRQWRWCAGFVSYCLKQAADTLGQKLPVKQTFSCDVLAESARQGGRLLDGDAAGVQAELAPGDLFLIRRSRSDWRHVGIITRLAEETFSTIEGNTNDLGSENGNEVLARTRSYKGRDFVRIAMPAAVG